MPDSTGLELIAQEVRENLGDAAVTRTQFYRGQATLEVDPGSVHDVLGALKPDWEWLMSLHACDYLPEEPRLGVHYQLLSRARLDRLNVKTRLGAEEPALATVTDLYPGAEYPEREVFDMFGVVFDGHPDMRRILMPEDYVGHPQRRDFPMGGEEVLFTFNEHEVPRWYDK
ncbi:MAG: NADH-quinone oxidoreductase subunit C [Thermoleophilaceae bacterium]|nr:NADH-quinone oxidoreductase subunit C [Thermoleophilaceae bacterium]